MYERLYTPKDLPHKPATQGDVTMLATEIERRLAEITMLQDVPGRQTGMPWPVSLTSLPFTIADHVVETWAETLEIIDCLEWLLCLDYGYMLEGQQKKIRKGRKILGKLINDLQEAIAE